METKKFRPATIKEIESNNTELYMNGERVYVMCINHAQEVGGKPRLIDIMLTNCKKVQPKDLQVLMGTTAPEPEAVNPEPLTLNPEPTMTTITNAADLVGKTINAAGGCKFVILSADGETVKAEFHRGESVTVMDKMPAAQILRGMESGIYTLATEDETPEAPEAPNAPAAQTVPSAPSAPSNPTAPVTPTKGESEGVSSPEPAKTIPLKPKAKAGAKAGTTDSRSNGAKEAKAVNPQPSAVSPQASARCRIEDYTVEKNGRTVTRCKIYGVTEDDDAYKPEVAVRLHASATSEYDAKAKVKVPYLAFSERNVALAHKICAAINAGETAEKLIAIAAAHDEEAKAAKVKPAPAAPANGECLYTEAEVGALLNGLCAGDEKMRAECKRLMDLAKKAA